MSGRTEHVVAEVTDRVTIVIPIYGHWPSLRACIESVIEHADPARYDVLLVNDCGPDADVLEAGVTAMTMSRPTFRYERNPRNLGFVQTCNRAVFELDPSDNDILLLNSDTVITAGALDEMVRVLALSPQHGAVCPRSNDATIASIPFFQRDRHAERNPRRAREVHNAIASSLPEFSIAPVAIGFCFLTRRSLIREYALFDEVFGRGYNEENDYCLRINAHGYSSVIANRAYVEHAGSASFGTGERAELERINSRVLHERYPFFPSAVVTYIHHGFDAVDRFADVIVPASSPPTTRVVVDLTGADESAVWGAVAVPLLREFVSVSEPLTEGIAVLTPPALRPQLEHEFPGLLLIDPDDAEDVFDVGLVLGDVTSIPQLDRLRRCCLRWVVISGDTGDGRSTRALVEQSTGVIAQREALAAADGVIDPDGKPDDLARRAWDLTRELLGLSVDVDRLRDRDRRISNLVRVWQHERARADAAQTLATRAQRPGVRAFKAVARRGPLWLRHRTKR